jgi:transcriptional regulator with XRE-family HTH domain
MTGYEYFEQILKDKGLKAYDVSKATGIRSGVFSDWKKGRYTPKADKMQKIADFLGVPVEPLLGVQTNEQGGDYYTDAYSAMVAQQMFEDKDIRALHHIKKNIDYQRFKAYFDMILNLYRQEHPDDDFYDREFTYRSEDGDNKRNTD